LCLGRTIETPHLRRRLESIEMSRKSMFRPEIGLRNDGLTFAVYTCQSKERIGEGRFRIAFFLPIFIGTVETT